MTEHFLTLDSLGRRRAPRDPRPRPPLQARARPAPGRARRRPGRDDLRQAVHPDAGEPGGRRLGARDAPDRPAPRRAPAGPRRDHRRHRPGPVALPLRARRSAPSPRPGWRSWRRNSTIPIINALTDEHHPCQALADVMTLEEEFGDLARSPGRLRRRRQQRRHSLIQAAGYLGFTLVVATPEGYEPDPAIVAAARAHGDGDRRRRSSSATTRATRSRGADAVYTDVWASMGKEHEREERRRVFAGYTRRRARSWRAPRPGAIFLHCLPAHRGDEVTDEVMDGPRVARLGPGREPRLHGAGAPVRADQRRSARGAPGVTRVAVALGGQRPDPARGAGLDGGPAPQPRDRRAGRWSTSPSAAGRRSSLTHGNGPQVGFLAIEAEMAAASSRRRRSTSWAPSRRARSATSWRRRSTTRSSSAAGSGARSRSSSARSWSAPTTRPSRNPTKPVGPIYDEATARAHAPNRGWTIAPDGTRWRRVVASPRPLRIVEAAADPHARRGGRPRRRLGRRRDPRRRSCPTGGSRAARRSSTRTSPRSSSPARSARTGCSCSPTWTRSTAAGERRGGARSRASRSTRRSRASPRTPGRPARWRPKIRACAEFVRRRRPLRRDRRARRGGGRPVGPGRHPGRQRALPLPAAAERRTER